VGPDVDHITLARVQVRLQAGMGTEARVTEAEPYVSLMASPSPEIRTSPLEKCSIEKLGDVFRNSMKSGRLSEILDHPSSVSVIDHGGRALDESIAS
jgi:hypothetical protein